MTRRLTGAGAGLKESGDDALLEASGVLEKKKKRERGGPLLRRAAFLSRFERDGEKRRTRTCCVCLCAMALRRRLLLSLFVSTTPKIEGKQTAFLGLRILPLFRPPRFLTWLTRAHVLLYDFTHRRSFSCTRKWSCYFAWIRAACSNVADGITTDFAVFLLRESRDGRIVEVV